jgi:hypothetical protein
VPIFVTPLLLAGGLLIAVPILLHLAMRQRPRQLEFPALRFLQARTVANRQRLKLRHLLLLILRCLALLLLAIALARPIFLSSGIFTGGNAPVAAALAFDTRPRMNYRHHNKTRLDVAKEMGLEVVGQLPRNSELVVIESSSPRTRFDADRGAAVDKIEQLTTTGPAGSLIDMVDNALRVLRDSDKQRKEVYLVTDMSAVDWDSKLAISAWQRRLADHPDVSFFLMDVGVEQPRNFSLGDLELSPEVLSETDLLRITSEVWHTGVSGKQTVELYLFDEHGEAQKRGEKIVDGREGQATKVDFQTRVGDAGILHGYLRLSRGDALEIDNIRYFTVEVRVPRKILVAAADPADSRSRMLTTALAPPTLRQRGETRYEIQVVPYEKLAAEKFAAFDAIWLLDPPPLAAKLWEKLTTFVDEGGGLAMALAGNLGTSPERFNATASWELLPARLVRQWRGLDLYLAPDRLEHPVLQRFKGRQDSIPWQQNPIFRIWELGPLSADTRTLLSYNDGRPALLARKLGKGHFLLLTTSLSSGGRTPWNDLLAPRENAWPGFVLVNAMADYLVGTTGQRLNYQTGEVARLGLDDRDEGFESYLLKTPTGSRRIVADDRGMELLISSTETPGHYRVGAGGKQGAEHGFSINLPSEATNLKRANREQLSENFGKSDLPVVTTAEQLSRTREDVEGRTRWEAYPWLILLVSIVVAGEGLLATFFYRKQKQT